MIIKLPKTRIEIGNCYFSVVVSIVFYRFMFLKIKSKFEVKYILGFLLVVNIKITTRKTKKKMGIKT